MDLIYNYHTHTPRCGHALGPDELYVINAIKSGIKELGFSDHVPFKDVSQKGVRMEYEEIDEYISSINKLKEKYKDQIKIYVGFEAEYFIEANQYYVDLLKKVDYLICGQHFCLDSNRKMTYVGQEGNDNQVIIDYVDRVIQAMESGLFSYIAHPDLMLRYYQNRDSFIEGEIRRMCVAASKYHVPLEINLEGFKRQVTTSIIGKELFYPYDYFWKIVSEYPVDVILGGDIHDPDDLLKSYDYYGHDLIKRFHLHQNQKLAIK